MRRADVSGGAAPANERAGLPCNHYTAFYACQTAGGTALADLFVMHFAKTFSLT